MFVKKMENVNRPKVDTLAELTTGNCFYISREHLMGEIAGYLGEWNEEFLYDKNPYKLFLAYMQNTSGHGIVMYAAAYNGMPIQPDINMVVDHFLTFAHHGNTNCLKKCDYYAVVSLTLYKTLSECRRDLSSLLNTTVPDGFVSLDLYPVDGARKIISFQD